MARTSPGRRSAPWSRRWRSSGWAARGPSCSVPSSGRGAPRSSPGGDAGRPGGGPPPPPPGSPPAAAALARAVPVPVAHAIRPGGRVLLLGSGGGIDAWAALESGATEVTIVEPNRLLPEALVGGPRGRAGGGGGPAHP